MIKHVSNPTGESSVCETCSSIFSNPFANVMSERGLPSQPGVPHLTISQVASAADMGCFICCNLRSAIEEKKIDERVPPGLKLTFMVLDNDLWQQSIHFTFHVPAPAGRIPVLIFQLHHINQHEALVGSTSLSAKSTGDRAVVAQAKEWLGLCQTDAHFWCPDGLHPSPWKPTRLLRILKDATSFQLCRGSRLEPKTPYATLSHCWGSQSVFTLTTSNQQLLEGGMKTDLLSRTFRDAMAFTHSMGLEYIWIDSLCIIQDSDDDWRYESTRMANVYQNGLFNVAATAASDGQKGMFYTRDAARIVPPRVHVRWNGLWPTSPETSIDGWYYLTLEKPFEGEALSAPLNQRGWVYQERALSPRIFHFCENQVWWECSSLLASEALPEGLLLIQGDGQSIINRKSLDKDAQLCTNPNPLASPAEPISMNLSETHSMEPALSRRDGYLDLLKGRPPFYVNIAWRTCVKTYSSCKLTYPKDKLVAINGVATAFRPWVKDEFVAGLWKRQILEDMLWKKPGLDPLSPPPEPRAPTWSWLSVDGEVSFSTVNMYDHVHRPFTFHTICLDSPVMRGDSEALDITTDAYIRLRGPLKRARLHETPLQRGMVASRVCGQAVRIHELNLDLVEDEFPQMLNWTNLSCSSPRSVDFPLMTKAGISMIRTTDIFLLPLLTARLLPRDVCESLAGLLLVPTGARDGEFFRVGCFAVEDASSRAVLLGHTSDILPERFESRLGNNMFTIRII